VDNAGTTWPVNVNVWFVEVVVALVSSETSAATRS